MPVDEIVKYVALALVSGSFLIVMIGGFLTAAGGNWRDGERVVTIKQWGPFIQGLCKREGGGEVYKGYALFGIVRLRRYEYGLAHLVSIGFAEDTAPLVDGSCMGTLKLRRRGERLEGTFEGRKFSFADSPARVTSVARVAPTERVWERA